MDSARVLNRIVTELVHRFNVGPVIFESDRFVIVTVNSCTFKYEKKLHNLAVVLMTSRLMSMLTKTHILFIDISRRFV